MRVGVDRERCIGAGRCVYSAAAVFDSGDDGLVVVLHADLEPSEVDEVRAAVRLCPAGAIVLLDAEPATIG